MPQVQMNLGHFSLSFAARPEPRPRRFAPPPSGGESVGRWGSREARMLLPASGSLDSPGTPCVDFRTSGESHFILYQPIYRLEDNSIPVP